MGSTEGSARAQDGHPMQGRVSDGPPGAPRRGALTPNRHTAAVSIDFTRTAWQSRFTLLEQKILLITGFTHIRLETLGSVEISAVDQQTPKEGEVYSEKFTGELIPKRPNSGCLPLLSQDGCPMNLCPTLHGPLQGGVGSSRISLVFSSLEFLFN